MGYQYVSPALRVKFSARQRRATRYYHVTLSRPHQRAMGPIGALHEIMAIVELCDVPKKFRFDSILFDSNWHFHNIPVVNRVYAALL